MKTHIITAKSMSQIFMEITSFYGDLVVNHPKQKVISIIILDNIELNEINASITYQED